MITLRITFKFRKKIFDTLTHSVFTMIFKSALKKGANLSLFHLSESDHKSETTMMTHQMCLMHRGKRAEIGFCRLQFKISLPMM